MNTNMSETMNINMNTPQTKPRLLTNGKTVLMVLGAMPQTAYSADTVGFCYEVAPEYVPGHAFTLSAAIDALDCAVTTMWWMYDKDTNDLVKKYKANKADLGVRAEFLLAVRSCTPQLAVLKKCLDALNALRNLGGSMQYAYFRRNSYRVTNLYFADDDSAWKTKNGVWCDAPNWVGFELEELDRHMFNRLQDANYILSQWETEVLPLI